MAKELTWHGKTEEEIKAMDFKIFMELIPARQRRSLTRGFTEQQKILLHSIESGTKNLKTHCRNMIILPSMLGKTIKVYNGKEFVPVLITVEMLGYYLSEFSHTRKSVTHSAAGIGATKSSRAISAK